MYFALPHPNWWRCLRKILVPPAVASVPAVVDHSRYSEVVGDFSQPAVIQIVILRLKISRHHTEVFLLTVRRKKPPRNVWLHTFAEAQTLEA